MRVLLDSHVLLWALAETARLGGETRATIESSTDEVPEVVRRTAAP